MKRIQQGVDGEVPHREEGRHKSYLVEEIQQAPEIAAEFHRHRDLGISVLGGGSGREQKVRQDDSGTALGEAYSFQKPGPVKRLRQAVLHPLQFTPD